MHRRTLGPVGLAAAVLWLLGASAHAEDATALVGGLPAAPPGQHTEATHTLKPLPGERVELTLNQEPLAGAGCLTGKQFHMFFYEGAIYQKVSGKTSIEVAECTQTLFLTSDKGEPLNIVVENWTTMTVPYSIDVVGAVSPTATPAVPGPTPTVGDPDTGFGETNR